MDRSTHRKVDTPTGRHAERSTRRPAHMQTGRHEDRVKRIFWKTLIARRELHVNGATSHVAVGEQ